MSDGWSEQPEVWSEIKRSSIMSWQQNRLLQKTNVIKFGVCILHKQHLLHYSIFSGFFKFNSFAACKGSLRQVQRIPYCSAVTAGLFINWWKWTQLEIYLFTYCFKHKTMFSWVFSLYEEQTCIKFFKGCDLKMVGMFLKSTKWRVCNVTTLELHLCWASFSEFGRLGCCQDGVCWSFSTKLPTCCS